MKKKKAVIAVELSDIHIKDVDHKFISCFEYYIKTEWNCTHNTAIKYITIHSCKGYIYFLLLYWIGIGVDRERWIKIIRTKTDSRSIIPILPTADIN